MLEAESERIAAVAGVRFRDLGGESVLLELESGRYFGLDEVATRMWTLLAEHGTLPPVERILLEEFEVDAERLHLDLRRFVDELENEHLVTRVSAPGAVGTS